MRNFIVMAACLLPTLAAAHTFSLPKGDTTVTVTIPDDLEPIDTLRGAEGGVAQERTFYVMVEPVDGADVRSAMEEGFKMLEIRGVEIDPASIKQTSRTINGLDATDFTFTISEGPEAAVFTLIATKAEANFMGVFCYGSSEGLKANANALTSIVDSIQPIKK
jgi:hypothetical protein